MNQKETGRTVRIFAVASFLNDFGSDMIYSLWPLFVTTVLGANMTVLGFIDGLSEAFASIAQVVSGYISDRIRRRKVFIWSGYLFASLSRAGYALSAVWQHLIPCRLLGSAGKIRGAPRDAVVADISTKENRGRNFGLLRAMDNLGGMCGIIVGIIFFELLGYRNSFLVAALPSAIGALLIFSLVKERGPTNSRIYRGLALKDLDRNFKLFLFLSSLFALGSFSFPFLLMYAKESGFQIAFVSVLYLLSTTVSALFSLPFGKLADKMGRKPVLMLSYILWGLVCISAILIRSSLTILLPFVLYGLHKGALDPVEKTLVSELAPIEYRASSLGGFQTVVGLCALPASLIAGMLWDELGMFAPFYFSLSLTILSIMMLIFVKEK